ncbi:hypothetical protein HPP92_007849 [Vanilla planifolia]|uniref:riboflavin kinase n=1 Tax=Vanilla planifolia TaxID=51239 RepID=A0A835REZ6_VANPL|nr:hypothetical protein HPP92_007849 [Vanilla planifolia]
MDGLRVSAVIFDLDGTLLDSERATGGVMREFLKKYGKVLVPEKEIKRLGQMYKDSAKAIVVDYELPLTPEEFSQAIMPMYQQRWPQAKALPGVNRLITHLHKHRIPIGLASNSIKKHIGIKISHQLGWKELFSVIIGGDEVNEGKPSPDIFIEAAKRLGVESSCCLVIEDSPVGVKAAKDAGATVVAVPSLQNQIERYSVADHILHSLLDFQPELWGLPAFDDWVQNALPIEPLHARGLLRGGFHQKECMLLSIEADDGSYNSFPDQVTGILLGWANLQRQGIFKMVAAVGWDFSSAVSKRTIKPYLFGEAYNLDEEAVHLVFVGYIRKLYDEENILEVNTPTKEDAAIAWAALDLPQFSKEVMETFN